MTTERLAETIDRLHGLIEPVLAREGFELVDFVYKRGSKGWLLRLMIDRAGRTDYRPVIKDGAVVGVTIRDCVRMSKLLSPILDVEDVVPTAYNLEISSPGVDRPLKTPTHFTNAVGLKVRVKTRVPVDGETFYIAPLTGADDDGITLEWRGGQVAVPYRLIQSARIEFEWGAAPPKQKRSKQRA